MPRARPALALRPMSPIPPRKHSARFAGADTTIRPQGGQMEASQPQPEPQPAPPGSETCGGEVPDGQTTIPISHRHTIIAVSSNVISIPPEANAGVPAEIIQFVQPDTGEVWEFPMGDDQARKLARDCA